MYIHSECKNISSQCAQLARDAESARQERQRVSAEIHKLFDQKRKAEATRKDLASSRDNLRGQILAAVLAAGIAGPVGIALSGGKSMLKNQLDKAIAEISKLNSQIAELESRIKIRNRDAKGLESSLKRISDKRRQLGC